MAAIHSSEEEQIEALKRWWQSYGKLTVAAILIGIVVSFGWRYWQQREVRLGDMASMTYEQVLADQAQQKTQLFQDEANQLIKDYKRTPYADLAALLQAKQAVIDKKFGLAEEKLRWVMAHANSTAIKQIARLRAARVLLAEKKLADALTLLNTVDNETFRPAIDEVQGEIYLAQGKQGQARTAYQAALKGLPSQDLSRPILQMKLNQLATHNQAAQKTNG